MNSYQAYQQQQVTGATRIDLLLMLYDEAIAHLSQAQQALARQDLSTAAPLLWRGQLMVYALASGVDLSHGEVPRNMLRLYEFALHCLGFSTAKKVGEALRVLTILREGWRGIRSEALKLERSGTLPPLASSRALRMTI